MNKPVNLNMLFCNLLPSYVHVLNALPEGERLTKADFISLVCETYDTKTNPRNNLFLHSIEQSEFETVKRVNSCAYFNE